MAGLRTLTALLVMGTFIIIALGLASAGTVDNPEITDAAGDSTGGAEQDIISAWFWNETETHFNITLMLDSIPPTGINLATVEYEVYFETDNEDAYNGAYAAALEYTFINSNRDSTLRGVVYGNGTIDDEVEITTIDHEWDSDESQIHFYVPKTNVGLGPGLKIHNTWARVWENATGASERQAVDTAHSREEPGLNYTIWGLMVTTEPVSQNVSVGDKAYFDLVVRNPSEVDINLTFLVDLAGFTITQTLPTASELPANHTIPAGGSISLQYCIDVHEGASGTPWATYKLNYTIEYHDDTTAVYELEGRPRLNIGTGGGGGGGGDGGGSSDDDKFFMGMELWQIASITVILVLVLIGLIWRAVA